MVFKDGGKGAKDQASIETSMLKGVNDPLVLPILVAGVLNTIAVAIGIVIQNAGLTDLRNRLDGCFNQVDRRFDQALAPKPKRPDEP